MNIFAFVLFLAASGLASPSDPRVAQLPTDLILVETVGPYRLVVFQVCSREHCWHDSFVQELNQQNPAQVICSAPIKEFNDSSDVIVEAAQRASGSISELKLSLQSSHGAFAPYVVTVSLSHGCGYSLRPTTPMAANNAFKPTSFRGSAQAAGKACHLVQPAARCGLT